MKKGPSIVKAEQHHVSYCKTLKAFGSTSIRWGDTENKENTNFQYPTYFPVTDVVKVKETNKNKEGINQSGPKKLSKLQQITATSVAVPLGPPEPMPLMEKSTSIEVSVNKHNYERSTNNISKISGPLRESELLDFHKKNELIKSTSNEYELDYPHREVFMESQERRLPLSKISNENSGTNDKFMFSNGQYIELNNIDEVAEEGSQYTFEQKQYQQNYHDFIDDEPEPKEYVPKPHALVTNYKEVRNQKKWNKVNNGLSMF